MPRPSVSILIDTYNHERFIEEAIVSVLEQDSAPADMEIIVVDDGSTDGTSTIVQKFAPRVRYLRKPNGGQASAFNFGIPETQGEIVTFLDGDDWWAPRKLASVLEAFARHPEVGMVGHAIFEVDMATGRTVETRPQRDSVLRLDSRAGAIEFSHMKAFMGTSRMAIRRQTLNRILPVPTDLVVEADEFIFTLAAALSGAMVLRSPLTYYRLHAHNLFQFNSRDPQKLRRKHGVMDCLVRELPPRLAARGVPKDAVEAIIQPVWIEAERLRLTSDGGNPWDTYRVERAAYELSYRKASPAYRVFKWFVLLATLAVPPRLFFRIKDWYAAKGLRRLRKVLGEPTAAATVIQTTAESGT